MAISPEMLPAMSEEEDDMEMPYQSIIPPRGFTPPKEAEGGAFDAVVRFKMEDGELVVQSINGIKMEGMEGEEEDEDEMEGMEPDKITADVKESDDMEGLSALLRQQGMM